MSEPIEIEMGTPEVSIDYASLGQSLLEECGESITEIANEAVEHYMRYELDISDLVSDYCNDAINDQIDSLLGEVGPGSLCGLGSSFRDSIETVLTHHIDMKDVLINNYAMESSGGISKLIQDSLKKEMVVNISFVDKDLVVNKIGMSAEDVTVSGHEFAGVTSDAAKDLLPGPVDEINTRSENV